MPKIKDIKAFEILDSRGNPTVEATVVVDNGISAKASVPSGASKGKHEALELRDGDKKRFFGKGVLKAIVNIQEKIKPLLLGQEVTSQKDIDRKMVDLDGTSAKSNLGANSILAVSLATAKVAAKSLNKPLYLYIQQISDIPPSEKHVVPMFNVLNGGLHGGGNFDFQEIMYVPTVKRTFSQNLRMGVELYMKLKKLLVEKNLGISVGDEGGFSPTLSSNEAALRLLREAVQRSDYVYGEDVRLGLDLAASNFFTKRSYKLTKENQLYSSSEFISYLENLIEQFGIFSLEDPLDEDDWTSWQTLTKKVKGDSLIIGDDLLVTNLERLKKAIENKACSAILVKVNQIGSLSEALNVVKRAKKAEFKVIISHRSGETTDDFIADLAVGVGADLVKFGAPARGERVAKYNRLLQIYQCFQ